MEPFSVLARCATTTSLAYLLLEQNRTEAGVESTDTLVLHHLAESSNKTIGICWLGNETDTCGLKRAERNISEEFCECGGGEVNGCAVVGSGLVSDHVDGLLFEKFITSKLESTLEEITGSGRTETCQESTSTFLCNDLSESANEALVICDWVELYSSLDAIKETISSNLCAWP